MARPLPTSILLGIALFGGCLLWGLALLFLARRLGGGLIEPLPAPAAAIASLSLAASAGIVRTAGLLSWLAHRGRLESWLAWTLFLLPGLACYLAAVAISLPQTTAAADAWLYLPLSLAEVVSLALGAWVIRHSDHCARWLSWPRGVSSRPPMVRRRDVEVSRLVLPADAESLPTGVSQHLVRRRLPDGHDAYQGILRVEFALGQRTEVVHVAFCPPFEATPQWTAKVVSGPALTIKQVQVFPYGARLEVRLHHLAAAAVDSLISFSAVESRT
ncbi:MAG: hypothetical protein K8T91_04970 [Planctomycetes bacterium]|nr:hypothetical protein [Planctomycetota bacterium]